MSFKEWLYSTYPNPSVEGQWGLLHIGVMLFIALFVTGVSLYFKFSKKDNLKAKRILLFVIAGIILFFELSRRAIFFFKNETYETIKVLKTLFPRPWCAISCWVCMIATVVNKKFFYNFASITSLLCALVFFAYPSVGFTNEYILFENLYSIVSHSCFLILALLFITLKFTDFKFKTMWKELICLGCVYVYGIFETFILKIEHDPLYCRDNNEIMGIFGMSYGLYIFMYVAFITVFWLSYYLIQNRKTLFKKEKQEA